MAQHWKIHGLLALIFFLLVGTLPAMASAPKLLMTKGELQQRMRSAAEEMSRILTIARDAHIRLAGPIDKDFDPNQTGLIGTDDSPIVSTQGQLGAKRTACVPDFAALVTRWLYEVGVQPDDKVAVVATGSFPGFNIAAICAIRAMGAKPVIQFSIAASEYGMTQPNFTLLDLDREIRKKIDDWNEIDVVTYGAGSDRGYGLPPDGKKTLDRAMKRNNKTPLVTGSLHEQITERLKLLEEKGPYQATIFIGGNIAALGTEEMKEIGEGLLPRDLHLGENHKESMMKFFLTSGIPVIYLHMSERLAKQWGIPFDPEPLPEPGSVERIFRW